MILQLTRLLAPASRIEFIRWRDERLKILDEEIMFWFCGPGLEPPTLFESPLSYCFEAIWSCTFDPTKLMPDSLEPEPQSQGLLKLHFSSHEIHARFPWARTTVTRTPVPLLSRFTAAQYELRIVELCKVFKFFCLWGTACCS
jgi:hypothetical protein